MEDDLYRKDSKNEIEFELVLQLDEFDFQKSAINKKKEGLKKWLNENNVLKIRRVFQAEEGKKYQ